MKKYLLIILAAAFCLVSCHKQPANQGNEENQQQEQEQVPQEGQYIDITGVTLEGTELSLSELVGKTDFVLLDFWASWCGPCRRFMPVLADFYYRFNDRLEILSCSVDRDEKAWREALFEERPAWPQIREDEAHPCSDKYDVQFIPHTVLIDKEGKIIGINLEEPELEEFLLEN
ncbi:MAG: TlpA family protein disulfide reductase [Paludibacteraceae bacterium]|nr:TlpA family protein disulfide reductase [Paludibacteraceae bacterium]